MMCKMLRFQSFQKFHNAIPESIDIVKYDFFMVIIQCGCSHHMKYFVQSTHSARQYHYIRFVQHNIFAVAQIVCTKGNIQQIAHPSAFFQFGRNHAHHHTSVFFGSTGNTFHQADIGSAIYQGLSVLSHPSSQFTRFIKVNRVYIIRRRTKNSNLIHSLEFCY